MPYDERAALDLLANAHATAFPREHEGAREEAARSLLREALKVAKKAGWRVGSESPRGGAIQVRPGSRGAVWVVADKDGVHVGHNFLGRDTLVGHAALRYDAANKEWVAADATPAGGAGVEGTGGKRDALSAVAELLVHAASLPPPEAADAGAAPAPQTRTAAPQRPSVLPDVQMRGR
jgi:hypothetical protein